MELFSATGKGLKSSLTMGALCKAHSLGKKKKKAGGRLLIKTPGLHKSRCLQVFETFKLIKMEPKRHFLNVSVKVDVRVQTLSGEWL